MIDYSGPTICERPYVSVDYAGIELVTLSQSNVDLFHYSRMAEAINAGQDLHSRIAARMLSTTYEDILARRKAKDKRAVDARQSAKPVNYGLGGGMGPPKLVFTAAKDGIRFCVLADGGVPCVCAGQVKDCFRCNGAGRYCGEKTTQWKGRDIVPTCVECLELAVKYKKLWLEEWEEMNDYFALISKLCDTDGFILSFGNGMKRDLTNDKNPFCSGSNHLFQNRAAQGAKRALYRITKEADTDRGSPLWDSHIAVFVHDENISEMPLARMPEAADRMALIMREEMQALCPDVRVDAEPAAMEFWYKGAETVRVDGVLQVWRPPCPGCRADGWQKACQSGCTQNYYPKLRVAIPKLLS